MDSETQLLKAMEKHLSELKMYEVAYDKEIEYITSPTELKAKVSYCNYQGWSLEDFGAKQAKIKEVPDDKLDSIIIDCNHNYDGCEHNRTLREILTLESSISKDNAESVGYKNI